VVLWRNWIVDPDGTEVRLSWLPSSDDLNFQSVGRLRRSLSSMNMQHQDAQRIQRRPPSFHSSGPAARNLRSVGGSEQTKRGIEHLSGEPTERQRRNREATRDPGIIPGGVRDRTVRRYYPVCHTLVDHGLYLLRNQSKMPPTRPPVSNAFFCFSSRLS
jgi:hypothetical protein